MASDILKEARADAAAMFINFSALLKKDILDSEGKFLGRIADISAKFGEIYPKLDEIIIKDGFIKKSYACVQMSRVIDIDDAVRVNIKSSDVKFSPAPNEYEFLLKRDVLDQQVVDTYNHKVRRVNDIHLLRVDHELMIAHVDIGLRGLIRRLELERAADLIVRLVNKNSKYLQKDDLVSWKYVQPVSVNPASMTMKLSFSEKHLASIPPADLGDIIFDLNITQRMVLFRTLDVKMKAKIFENLEFEEQQMILKELDKKEAAEIVERMSSDEATDLLERLPRGTVKNILTLVESNMAKRLSTLLGYSSDSAGGLMTTEFVALPEDMTVVDAIEHIRNNTREFDLVPYIYIIDDKFHLKGITTVRRLLFEDPKDVVLKAAFPKTLYVYLDNSVKEVAHFMEKYKMSAIPVIDENKVLHGIVTMDDILNKVITIAWRKRPRKTAGL